MGTLTGVNYFYLLAAIILTGELYCVSLLHGTDNGAQDSVHVLNRVVLGAAARQCFPQTLPGVSLVVAKSEYLSPILPPSLASHPP